MLAVPLSTYRSTYETNENGITSYNYEFVSTLKMINVDIENESLSLHGSANHSNFYNSDNGDYYFYDSNIRRSIFMGEFIYSFSALGAAVHKIDDMSVQVELDLPGHQNTYYEEEVEVSDSED